MKRSKDRLHKVIVIGTTPAGISATNKLGELGIPVTLVDNDYDLDLKLSRDDWKLKSGLLLNHAHRPGLIRILRNSAIQCIIPAEVTSIKHTPQGFRVRINRVQTFVDPDRCTLCGRCVEICPVSVSEEEKAIKINSSRAFRDERLSTSGVSRLARKTVRSASMYRLYCADQSRQLSGRPGFNQKR